MAKPDQAIPLFIALEPDAGLGTLLHHSKQRLRELVGPQLYLDDPPHLTLYLALFVQPQLVLAQMASLAQATVSARVQITGWHVFTADPLTGNHTLVCDLDTPDKEKLRLLQESVVSRLAPLRHEKATRDRFAARWDHLGLRERACVQQCGFPYIGSVWHPHFTIASIRPEDWSSAWTGLQAQPPLGCFTCPRLAVYRLSDGQPFLLSSYGLEEAG